MKKNNTGAVIITFFPTNNLINMIEHLRSQVEKIVIVDNGSLDKKSENILNICRDMEVIVFQNRENMGIARALNKGCEFLYENNIEYAVTLDQDSNISNLSINILLMELLSTPNIAIIGPEISVVDQQSKSKNKNKYIVNVSDKKFIKKETKNVDTLRVAFNITSGSLIDLGIWNRVGKFMGELFIEGVDDEYCLRIIKNGYNTCVTPKTVLLQTYGNQKFRKIFGFSFNPTFHTPERNYYTVRNKVIISKKYKKYVFYRRFQLISLTKRFITIILFENNKLKQIKAFYWGIIDGNKNVLGKVNDRLMNELKVKRNV